MNWENVRENYPNQWVLVEAIEAHSESGKRIIDQLAVLNIFPDSLTAMRSYKELHKKSPNRELYVLHTNRKALDILERKWIGIRGSS
ncbi:MAG TPA: hypothetical protein VJL89_08365 [Thermodesulfovibrionia bacterium]|nr:hypothetical protein [Thermodesulfovibrionia bacterium]